MRKKLFLLAAALATAAAAQIGLLSPRQAEGAAGNICYFGCCASDPSICFSCCTSPGHKCPPPPCP